MASGLPLHDLADGQNRSAQRIRSEQVRLLFGNADPAVAVTLLVSSALAYLQWEAIARSTLLAWLAYMAAVSGLRFALARAFFRVAPTPRATHGWEVAFILGTALAAAGWGASGILLYPPEHLTNQVFLVFVLGGMMLGGGAILAPRPEAFLVFLIPTGLPVAIRFLAQGDSSHLAMGLLMVLFTAATLITTWHVFQTVTASLRLRFENTDLVSNLQVATQRLEALNQELETRVAQRTAELDQTVARLKGEIAERRRAEEERAALEASLRHAQKLEAIGVLSSGIAHEFNNLLTSIGGYTAMVRDSLTHDTEACANLDEVLKAGDRAANLVRRLLVFSRKTQHEPKLIPIGTTVSDALELVRSSLPSTITLTPNIGDDCGHIFADPNLIRQIVINLCTNAYDAMSGRTGLLEVTLAPVELGSSTPSQPGLADGPYVKLTVRDTGPGIPSDIAERVFEPFFTTKPAGTATGLGLSVVHGIVTTYGGRITFESRPSEGTRFVVFLPRRPSPVEIREHESESEGIASQRVLIVDDQEAIARLGAGILQRLGHIVTPVTSSPQALRLFLQDPDSFDLVVTDLTMPQMTGSELIREIRNIRPHLPIILMSGFNDVGGRSAEMQLADVEFVGKPFSRSAFEDAICRALRGQRRTRPAV